MKTKAVRITAGIAASAAVVAGLVFAGNTLSNTRKIKAYQKEALTLPEGFTVTAHAGALGTKDNTYESLKTCLDFIGGEGCIETDVRFNSEGTPLLWHNTPKESDKPLLLSEFFTLLKGYPAHVNLDLKEYSNLPEVRRLAEEYGVLPQLFFTGVQTDHAELVRKNAGGIPYYINEGFGSDNRENLEDRDYLQTVANNVKRFGGIGLNIHYNDATQALVEVMHENGLLVSVWTVNKQTEMCRMLSYGVDNITTRKPDVLRELINGWA